MGNTKSKLVAHTPTESKRATQTAQSPESSTPSSSLGSRDGTRLSAISEKSDDNISHTSPQPSQGFRPQFARTESTTPKGPARQLRVLSELIDPSILNDEHQVKSPSGNLLGRQAFSERADRPLSMRERQEKIRQELDKKQSYAVGGIGKENNPNASTGIGDKAGANTSTGPLREQPMRRGCFCF